MITIDAHNKLRKDDDITYINAKLNAIGKSIKDTSVDDYCRFIKYLKSQLPPTLKLNQQIIAKDFINIINVYDSDQDLISNKCIQVNKVRLKATRNI